MNNDRFSDDIFATDSGLCDDISVFDNPQPRCPVALVLDTSYSMAGQPIEELNRGVVRFFEEIMSDDFARFSVETQLITFGGHVAKHGDFISCASPTMPSITPFQPNGCTPLGEALGTAITTLEERKQFYKKSGISYYQPWLIVMTDGSPNDAWQTAAAQARELSDSKQLVFLGIGIGNQADITTLSQILPTNRPPKKLDTLKFEEFFIWLSASMSGVSRSSVGDRVPLPATDGWEAV